MYVYKSNKVKQQECLHFVQVNYQYSPKSNK
jgi:hypothetical protein